MSCSLRINIVSMTTIRHQIFKRFFVEIEVHDYSNYIIHVPQLLDVVFPKNNLNNIYLFLSFNANIRPGDTRGEEILFC